MFWEAILALLLAFLAWAYKAIRPPPPLVHGCTGPRIKLRDGRFLSYKEYGVPKERAKYNAILIHGFGSSKNDDAFGKSELVEKLGVHVVAFDRPGYGESDPDPKRSPKSIALDIAELGDELGFGPKFYVVGCSMGGQLVWGCLKYIPHRLAGAALLAPVINYRWPSFPPKLAKTVFRQELPEDQWASRVARYAPWLVYWWNTQKWFPPNSVIAGRANFSAPDLEILSKFDPSSIDMAYPTQQGVYESLHRDMIVAFGAWEFDPMEIDDPFPGGEGSVHMWQGDQDGLVPVTLQRYIAKRLHWIKYHEMQNTGHMFLALKSAQDEVLEALFA
ncbi:uncharacterized protein LOC121788566 [Salvia splendens]|nr:uncharacterized protein LOC121788566 [Salvia splendens]XP_042043159.1 uncharacterized protein LOC121788566 [Salvia splendens]